jgi:hypothetical protein
LKVLSAAIVSLVVLSIFMLPSTIQSDGSTILGSSYLNGSGTKSDPFLVSSVNDLRMMSDFYHMHDGAYYKQTQDIIFSDAGIPDNRVTLSASVIDDHIMISITTDLDGISSKRHGYISFNDIIIQIEGSPGFSDIYFPINCLKEKNSVIAAGTIGEESFAIALSFSDKNVNASVCAPFKGNFTPIGTDDDPFIGIYDGNGYLIKGIKATSMEAEVSTAGLFGNVISSIFYNISIISDEEHSSYIIAASIKDLETYYSSRVSIAGGLAASVRAVSIIDCLVDCIVSSMAVNAPLDAYSLNTISFSVSGGLIGLEKDLLGEYDDIIVIRGCLTSGTTSAISLTHGNFYSSTGFAITGGSVGAASDIYISKSGNVGDVYCLIENTFTDSTNIRPEININSNAGGIIGNGLANITDTYNTGDVCSVTNVTFQDYSLLIKDNFSSITLVGGCAGDGQQVTNFYNAGELTGRTQIMDKGESAQDRLMISIDPVACSSNEPPIIKGSYFLMGTLPGEGYDAEGKTSITSQEMALMSTFEGWDFDKIWKISDGRPAISLRYDMTVIDTSGTFDGTARYSLDRNYTFDDEGTAFSFAGRDGFLLMLADGYQGSDIIIYMIIEDEVVVLDKEENNKYMIPAASLFDMALGLSSDLTLYIDGLEFSAPEVPDPEEPEVPDPEEPEAPSDKIKDVILEIPEKLGTAGMMVIIITMIIIVIVTVYNLKNTIDIMLGYALSRKSEHNDKDDADRM